MLAFRHCRCWTDYVQLGLPVLACIRPLSVCTPVNVGPILDLCWAECQINVGPIMPCRNRTLIVWQQSAQFQLVTTSYINPRFSSPRTRCVLLGECYQAAGRQSCSAAHRLCRLKQCWNVRSLEAIIDFYSGDKLFCDLHRVFKARISRKSMYCQTIPTHKISQD